MIVINKPEELIDVQCYRCKATMKASPFSNMNSDYFTDCQLHKPLPIVQSSGTNLDCKHDSDSMIYCSSLPPQLKCKKCGIFYT
jgi:hypothetical protein